MPKKVKPLRVLDACSGKGGATQAFVERGHEVITVDNDPRFQPTVVADLANYPWEYLEKLGPFDFIWASPPCPQFSTGAFQQGHFKFDEGLHYQAMTAQAHLSLLIVHQVVAISRHLKPRFGWLMENPNGLLQKMPVTRDLGMAKVTYCQYAVPCPQCGESVEQPWEDCSLHPPKPRQKPTVLFSDRWPVYFTPKVPCGKGQPCHEAAPRGARTGTQGLKNAEARSMVAYGLSRDVCFAIETAAAYA